MSAWTIYLWTRLDTIVDVLEILWVCALIVVIGAWFITGMQCITEGEDEYKLGKRATKKFFWWIVLLGALIVVVPTSKEFAMIYVIPKVANSQVIQKDVPELYQMAVDALKEKLVEKDK